jgi:type I restriction enzyme, S subunit
MSDWEKYRFSDFVEINPTVSLKSGNEYSFVEMKDLQDGNKFCFPKIKRNTSSGVRFQENDTLFARITPCLENGKICQVKGLENEIGFGSTEFLVFRGKENISDNDFVFYLSRWDEVREFAEGNFEGTSGRQRVPKNCFDNLFLKLPELSEQCAIASLLSSLDDKIDLLHRQNKTLEQLAETIFRQWFIEEADKSWKVVKLGTLGKIICGKTPSKKVAKYFNGEIPFIKIPDMHGKTFVFNSEDSLTELGLNLQSRKTLPPKSICVSCIATVGLVVMNAKIAQTNQQINSIIPAKEIYRYFLYLKMLSLKDELLAMASGGTATDNLNTGDFSNIDVVLPAENLLKEFDGKVKPLFEKIYNNQTQIHTLAQLRDTLLPKLMSGDVRVNNLKL